MKQQFHVIEERLASHKWRVVDRNDDRRERAYYTRKEARKACDKLNKGELTWDDLWKRGDDLWKA